MAFYFLIHGYSISSAVCTLIYFFYCTVLLSPGRSLFLLYSLFQCTVTYAAYAVTVFSISLLHMTHCYLLSFFSCSVYCTISHIPFLSALCIMSTVSSLALTLFSSLLYICKTVTTIWLLSSL